MMTTKIFRIGASGHRDLGDAIAQQYAARCIRELLTSYKEQYPNLVLIAPFAIGADQLFVQIALDLNIPVEAVIPSEDYETATVSAANRNTAAVTSSKPPYTGTPAISWQPSAWGTQAATTDSP